MGKRGCGRPVVMLIRGRSGVRRCWRREVRSRVGILWLRCKVGGYCFLVVWLEGDWLVFGDVWLFYFLPNP